MAIKLKGTPAGIKSLLSGGTSGPGNGIHGPMARESRNKSKVDRNPSAVPKRPSAGAVTAKRTPKPNILAGLQTETAEPQAYGQPYNM